MSEQGYLKTPAKMLEHGHAFKDEGNRSPNLKIKRKCYEMALALYEFHTKTVPNSPLGFKATADLYLQLRDFGPARKNYEKVLALAPDDAHAKERISVIEKLLRGAKLDCTGTLKCTDGTQAPKTVAFVLRGLKADLPGVNEPQDVVTSEKTLLIQGKGADGNFKIVIHKDRLNIPGGKATVDVEESFGAMICKGSLECKVVRP